MTVAPHNLHADFPQRKRHGIGHNSSAEVTVAKELGNASKAITLEISPEALI